MVTNGLKNIFLLLFSIICLSAFAEAGQEEGDTPDFREKRQMMVRDQIAARRIKSPSVLSAMEKVLRHQFVPRQLRRNAYADRPLPIGEGQTISQPYIVALMTHLLELNGTERVLEVGTGSGYQAAVLGYTAKEVFSIEIKEKLCRRATRKLTESGFDRIHIRCGDGYFGWPEKAPFDAIMITAAVDHIPPPLIKQLKEGGRLVLPLGNPFVFQNLVLVNKVKGDLKVKNVTGVLFVPMTGQALKGH